MLIRQLMRQVHPARGRARKWAAGLLFALYLLALGIAHSEALHRTVHSDAQDPQHQCAATLLNSKLIDAAPACSFDPFRSVVLFLPPAPELAAVPCEERFLLPNRGPPFSACPAKVAGARQV